MTSAPLYRDRGYWRDQGPSPRQRVPFPRVRQQAPLPPEGMEFFKRADGSMGVRKPGSGKTARNTEFERLLQSLPEKDRPKARQVKAGLKGRAGLVGDQGKAGTPDLPVKLSLNPADPNAQMVTVQVKKPGDVETIRDMNDKVAGQPAERIQGLWDQQAHILDLYEKRNATVRQVDALGNETFKPKYGEGGNKFLDEEIKLAELRYQRDADTDGILTEGGPGLPGTKLNPYLPASETEMYYLEPMDYFIDPEGNPRQWQADVVREGISSPEALYAERKKYIKAHPRERPEPPKEPKEPKVQRAGVEWPKGSEKSKAAEKTPKVAEKIPKTEAELRKSIARLKESLKSNLVKKSPRTQELIKGQIAKMQAELDALTEKPKAGRTRLRRAVELKDRIERLTERLEESQGLPATARKHHEKRLAEWQAELDALPQ